jgi:hypothetical protein
MSILILPANEEKKPKKASKKSRDGSQEGGKKQQNFSRIFSLDTMKGKENLFPKKENR